MSMSSAIRRAVRSIAAPCRGGETKPNCCIVRPGHLSRCGAGDRPDKCRFFDEDVIFMTVCAHYALGYCLCQRAAKEAQRPTIKQKGEEA